MKMEEQVEENEEEEALVGEGEKKGEEEKVA